MNRTAPRINPASRFSPKPNQMKALPTRLTLALLLLALTFAPALTSSAAPARQPVHGTPVICGRKIEQFVLLEEVDFTPDDHFSLDLIHGFPKNLFTPVSEDGRGVYYQALNGVTVGRPTPPFEHHIESGGVYFSKTIPGSAYGYLGDARNQSATLTTMAARVSKPALEKFRIGQAAPAQKK